MVTFILMSEKGTVSSIHHYGLSADCVPATVLGSWGDSGDRQLLLLSPLETEVSAS